jgi:hypothetical protein
MTGGDSEELVYAYSEDGLFLSGILEGAPAFGGSRVSRGTRS